jgi:hypothetical protein
VTLVDGSGRGRRRELVAALKQADHMMVTLGMYWNRDIDEVRAVLEASPRTRAW